MIITNCPRCGAMNATTTCAKCGWSQFAQVTMVSTRITGEIEIMLSGKALLDDYKRLLLENRNLKECVAELESMVDKLIEAGKQSMNFTEGFCNNADRDKPEYWHNWNAIVAEYEECER